MIWGLPEGLGFNFVAHDQSSSHSRGAAAARGFLIFNQ
jgi:hypothetical protein